MNVTVSVCIVTFNSADDITTCIEGVMSQSYPVQDIVIVDNASIDDSLDKIKQLIEKSYPIKLIENKINNGFAGGQNQAIAEATGDYVVVLNPDVELNADYVKHTVLALMQLEEAGSATGLLVRRDNQFEVDTTGLYMPFNRHAIDRGMGEHRDKWQAEGEVFGASGAAAVYKRAMIEHVKLDGEFFDEHFFAYKEDVDVAWRAQLLGWKAIFVPAATAIHARGWKEGGRGHISLFVRQHSYRNQIYMLVKNERINRSFIWRLPVLVLRELAKLAYIIIKERDLLKSWKTMFKTLPTIILKRKKLNLKIKAVKK